MNKRSKAYFKDKPGRQILSPQAFPKLVESQKRIKVRHKQELANDND